MEAAVRELLTSLQGVESVEPQWAVVDEWAAGGEVDRLREAAFALASPPGLVQEWAAESVFDRIANLLSLTPGLDFARAACAVARVSDVRLQASVTATGQPVDVCAELIAEADDRDAEFLTCLVQELVLRVERLDRQPFLRFWRSAQSSGHELGWLGLELMPIEASITLPSYSVQGTAYAGPGAAAPAEASGEDATSWISPIASEVTDVAVLRLEAAVANWLALSNGRIESRAFALTGEEPKRELADELAQAKLESLGADGRPIFNAVAAEDAFADLFAAASTGGAYESGHRGAYGRLRGWQSVGALAGAPVDDPIEAVCEAARRARWFGFRSDWFYDVAWDVGLAVVNPAGTRLAVLAATDTD